jgi:hypothetical protein
MGLFCTVGNATITVANLSLVCMANTTATAPDAGEDFAASMIFAVVEPAAVLSQLRPWQ